MNLASRKALLVNPEGQTPPGWPAEWPFPLKEAMPPGYPKKYTGKCKLEAALRNGDLIVNVLDEFDEPTDELEGHFLEVRAFQDDGNVIRIKQKADQPWSKRALFRVNGTGLVQPTLFEVERLKPDPTTPFHVAVSLYAHTGLETEV